MKRILIAIAILLSSAPVWAVTPAELANTAQAAYLRGDYEVAVQNWKSLSEIGFVNGQLFSNIGNAYWREGKVGLARLYFLKAKSLDPRNSEIRANLEYIQHPGTAPSEASSAPERLLKKIPFHYLLLNRYEALWIAAIAGFILFLGLFVARRRDSRWLRWASLVLILPWLWGGVELGHNLYFSWGERPGILIVPESALLAHPVTGGPELVKISEGTEVHVIKKQGSFYQVKTLEGQKGWLPEQSIGEVG